MKTSEKQLRPAKALLADQLKEQREQEQLLECAQRLYGVVLEVMPQIGGIVIQNYYSLNRGMMLAERLKLTPPTE